MTMYCSRANGYFLSEINKQKKQILQLFYLQICMSKKNENSSGERRKKAGWSYFYPTIYLLDAGVDSPFAETE